MSPIKAILIDDEAKARSSLQLLLTQFCPEVEILGAYEDVPAGVLAINKLKPQVVFLDIEMPQYSGFELFDFFQEVNFEVIFVTAYSEYALKAFEVSAVDYVLKPVSIDDLRLAIAKLESKLKVQNMASRLEALKENMQEEIIKRIALPVSDGLLFVEPAWIMLLEAEGSYTNVFLRDGSKLLVSKKMKFFEDILLKQKNFFRTHRSYIVNFNYVKKYSKADSMLLLDNQMMAPVSRERKLELEQTLKEKRIG